MPTYVIKTAPDEDFYVQWSTVADNFVFAGTRAESLDFMHKNAGGMQAVDPEHRPEARIARADVNGTSAMWPEDAAGPDLYLGWNDELLIVENDEDPEAPDGFWIRRADLRRYVEHGPSGIWFEVEEES